MLILNWTHRTVSCPSFGNIVAHATASEYIYRQLGQDIGVRTSEYYSWLWKLYLPQNRINVDSDDERLIRANELYVIDNDLSWFDSFIHLAGFKYESKIDPQLILHNNNESNQVLLYPREYDNKNRYFDLQYWTSVVAQLKCKGYRVGAILDRNESHRDGTISSDWCNEFRSCVQLDVEYENSPFGLQRGIIESAIAIGRGNGPACFMIKSPIRQILLDSEDEHIPRYNARRTFSKVAKYIQVHVGKTLDWMQEL